MNEKGEKRAERERDTDTETDTERERERECVCERVIGEKKKDIGL